MGAGQIPLNSSNDEGGVKEEESSEEHAGRESAREMPHEDQLTNTHWKVGAGTHVCLFSAFFQSAAACAFEQQNHVFCQVSAFCEIAGLASASRQNADIERNEVSREKRTLAGESAAMAATQMTLIFIFVGLQAQGLWPRVGIMMS